MPNNIIFYPYTAPIILTDDLFVQYGGSTGSSTAAQRQTAYFLAESMVSQDLGTFLLPTNVTGTYMLHPVYPIQTDYGYVNSVNTITIYSRKGDSSCTFSTTSSCAYLRNAQLGVLDVRLVGNCACGGVISNPYQIEIAYTAGLPSGTTYNSTIINALALYANEELKELTGISPTPGGVGIIEWENQEYREKRMGMKETVYGSTAIAQKVERLIKPFKRYRYVGL